MKSLLLYLFYDAIADASIVQEQCQKQSKKIVEKLQKLITSPSPALTPSASAADAQNGYADPDIDSVTINQLGNEYVSGGNFTRVYFC
ncbi:hypothetical protein AWC38_SpisGene5898 [Stylophora pistillata]|uniref:Uncharacterized protein n=1 Tax=Stylophora pistillata TaxID=50429 RepID=A0A2B4SLS3_STYPI|nr:hypothetical protein AWC38_SpisGene5898 [Stylophora pistillata]